MTDHYDKPSYVERGIKISRSLPAEKTSGSRGDVSYLMFLPTRNIDHALRLVDLSFQHQILKEALSSVAKRFDLHIRSFNSETDGVYTEILAREIIIQALLFKMRALQHELSE